MTLNGKKCIEMIIDFRKEQTEIPKLKIGDQVVERVGSYKLLGLHIDDNLKWGAHTWSIIKQSRKRLYFLKLLKNYGAPKR